MENKTAVACLTEKLRLKTITIKQLWSTIREKDAVIAEDKQQLWKTIDEQKAVIAGLQKQVDQQNNDLRIMSEEFQRIFPNIVDPFKKMWKEEMKRDFDHFWQKRCADEKLKTDESLKTFQDAVVKARSFELELETKVEEAKRNDSEWQERYTALEMKFKSAILDMQLEFNSKLMDLKEEVLSKQRL